MKFWKYLGLRFITYIAVIWIGVTFIFFIPRFFPSDPVEAMIGRMQAQSGSMDPQQVVAMRTQLRQQFGLEGSLLSQYGSFLKNALFHFDFGPSLINFPTPATELIGRYMPYTLGLTLFTTLFAWIIGNIIGLLAGFRPNKRSSKILEGISIVIYPIPYFIVAIVLQILFCYVWKIFPLTTTFAMAGGAWMFIKSVIYNSILPAASLVLIGTGWWIISMKAISSAVAQEDFVLYARFRGLSEGKIGRSYVFRNSILSQITALAMSLGGVFNGALMTEIIFGYPGVGKLMQNAILQSDYNLILGTITISIIAISTATLIADIIYPFIDPRIRYS